jgi:predicted MFS family arabinose efflux permease
MTTSQAIEAPAPAVAEPRGLSSGLILLLATTCAMVAAGSYFSQPLLPVLGPEMGLGSSTGLIVSLTQIGFCAGLVLVAPLGDLIENRRLVLIMLSGSVAALTLAAFAKTGAMLLASSLLIGFSATSVQVLVPLAAQMARPQERGRVMGKVTSGLLFGALLARPIASSVTFHFGWRALFGGAALAVGAVALLLSRALPERRPQTSARYGALLLSLWKLPAAHPLLMSRALTQAMLFGAFSLFWTAVPFELTQHYGLTQQGIALFAVAGAGGALSAIFAGRLADRGWAVPASGIAILVVGVAFAVAGTGGSLWLLGAAAIVLDAGVQCNHVLSQKAVVSMAPAMGSRLNSLYVTTFIVGGAVGSSAAAPLVASGWRMVAGAGAVAAFVALSIWFLRLRTPAARA